MRLRPEEARIIAKSLLEEHSEADAAPVPAGDDTPSRIGKYEILRVIGSGAMGTVYEARQDQPDRTVALKVMKRGLLSKTARHRFVLEAEMLGRLHHKAIGQVYEVGTHDDGVEQVPFFAMELIPCAQSITDYARAKDLGIRQRLELFADVCGGVQHGHQKGVIHRDLKPDNILVDELGQPKIIDFGVARMTDADISLTTINPNVKQIVGTLRYMSPEQCDGDPARIDTRSDVYSLGVILYELLCGQLPYDLSNSALPRATRTIQEDDPVRPSAVRRSLRGDLEAITLTALEKDPVDRYQSAAELANDIRRHLAGDDVSVRASGHWRRVVRWLARHPVLATAASCAAMVAMTAAATTYSVWRLALEPFELQAPGDGRNVVLISRAGAILKRWTSPMRGGLVAPPLIRPPADAHDGALAVLGFGPIPGHRWAGSLCVFDVDRDLEEPFWSDRILVEDLPAERSGDYPGDAFAVAWVYVADIFPDPIGPEIIASFIYRSLGAIRVYDLHGSILYQVWLDGSTQQPYWMSGAGLLVVSGFNSEVYWLRRGHPEVRTAHPSVVFALRPVKGVLLDDLVQDSARELLPTMAWYRCLLPPEIADEISLDPPLSPIPPHDPTRSVQLVMRRRSDEAQAVWLALDETGREIPGSRGANDRWNLAENSLDLFSFRIGDLPRILAPDTSK